MAIGIVNDADFEKEINNLGLTRVPVSYDNARVVTPLPLGRGKGNGETPEVLRKIIGECAIEDGNQEVIEALAEPLGISKSSVSAYKKGATSTASYNDPDKSLKIHTDFVKNRISRRASKRLNDALGHITDEKMEGAKLKDLSALAKDMSIIMKNMEPPKEDKGDAPAGVNIVFMAPRVKDERQYETITVNE